MFVLAVVAGVIAALLIGVLGGYVYEAGIERTITQCKALPKAGGKRLLRVFIGPEGIYVTRTAVALVGIIGSVSGVGLFYALTTNVQLSGSSAPILSAMLDWATNGWGYVIAALWFGRSSLFLFRRSLIRKSSDVTGYSRRTIERLAAEAKSTDGCSRIVALSSDTADDLAQNIRWGFLGKDERIRAQRESSTADVVPVPSWWTDEFAEDWDMKPAERSLSIPERIKLFRMDLATSLNADDIVWRFAVPASLVFAVELIIARVWVWWPIYIAMAGVALAVGGLTYTGSKWYRHRQLESLRADHDGESWDEVSVLVKKVETDDLTIYYGFLAGRTYASTDPERLSNVLAKRAHQRANGLHPAPAIEERWAWCLKRYIPVLQSWKDIVEKPRIMDTLADTVADAPEGVISKEQLAHRVVEHDRRHVWRGLRFVGFGHDPDLVRECYEELVPEALVEDTVTVSNPEGEERDLTLVRLRTEPLPPNTAELRASFSARFRSRDYETRYDLPEVVPDEDAKTFVAPPTSMLGSRDASTADATSTAE